MMKYNAVVASVPYDALHMSCSGFLTCIPCTNEVDCDAFCSSAYLCLKHNTTTHHMVSALQLTVFWNCILDPCYWQCNRGTVFMDQLYCQCGTVFLAVFSRSCILGSDEWLERRRRCSSDAPASSLSSTILSPLAPALKDGDRDCFHIHQFLLEQKLNLFICRF